MNADTKDMVNRLRNFNGSLPNARRLMHDAAMMVEYLADNAHYANGTAETNIQRANELEEARLYWRKKYHDLRADAVKEVLATPADDELTKIKYALERANLELVPLPQGDGAWFYVITPSPHPE